MVAWERERSALDSSATMCHAQLMFLILLRRHSSGVSWKEFKKDVSMFQNSLAYPRTLMSCLWSKVYRRILWCQPCCRASHLPLMCIPETVPVALLLTFHWYAWMRHQGSPRSNKNWIGKAGWICMIGSGKFVWFSQMILALPSFRLIHTQLEHTGARNASPACRRIAMS